jgi:hypothetical protein
MADEKDDGSNGSTTATSRWTGHAGISAGVDL